MTNFITIRNKPNNPQADFLAFGNTILQGDLFFCCYLIICTYPKKQSNNSIKKNNFAKFNNKTKTKET